MNNHLKNWLDASREDLEKLIERNGKVTLLHTLVANAWDTVHVSRVEVVLHESPPWVTVVVVDDALEGSADLSHTWVLSAEPEKYAARRGRLGLGERLVLSLCVEASIVSTRNAVLFNEQGRSNMRARRGIGTEFHGVARITRTELIQMRAQLKRLISPKNITTIVNGEALATRTPIRVTGTTLPTEIIDEKGALSQIDRVCTIDIYEPMPGEPATLYEMGIPISETGGLFHVDVQQKIPLGINRVDPSYIHRARAAVALALQSKDA